VNTITYDQIKEKRLIVPLTELIEWEKNYKFITTEDFEQLKRDVENEDFRPLIVTPVDDGKLMIIGGNQRFKAKIASSSAEKEAWVSVVDFRFENDKWIPYTNGVREKHLQFNTKEDGYLHYALKDNEERGQKDELKLQELAYESTLNLEEYKVNTETVNLKALVEQVSPQEKDKKEEPNDIEVTCPNCGTTFIA